MGFSAFRYDFVVRDGRYPCKGESQGCEYKHRMPFLSSLAAQHSGGASVAFRYVADAPTTTTQRLKSMTAGSLPSFFDVSNAFSAPQMDEDTIIDQLKRQGKVLTFMGDATWKDLFPTQFNPSRAFPCYNIMDLDTVDDGVNAHLNPTLRNHTEWDVLVAHYLGVDHAGHAYGVQSDKMASKLRQIDENIKDAVKIMVDASGPGEPYENALLVIAGDHGQTLTGDHGGGSPEEVDSAFIAVDISSFGEVKETGAETGLVLDPCRTNCTCGPDENQCVGDLSQIDAVPTLSMMLQIPIPFGNVGKMSEELWSLSSRRCKHNGDDQNQLLAALQANARQVVRYLDEYAKKPGSRFPSSDLQKLHGLMDMANRDNTREGYLRFLSEAEATARAVWTQFHGGWMLAGACLFALVVAFQYTILLRLIKRTCLGTCYEAGISLVPWLLHCAHACGIFSFFYLLKEGTLGLIYVVHFFFTIFICLSDCAIF